MSGGGKEQSYKVCPKTLKLKEKCTKASFTFQSLNELLKCSCLFEKPYNTESSFIKSIPSFIIVTIFFYIRKINPPIFRLMQTKSDTSNKNEHFI